MDIAKSFFSSDTPDIKTTVKAAQLDELFAHGRELSVRNETLIAENEQLIAEIEALLARNKELKALLGKGKNERLP